MTKVIKYQRCLPKHHPRSYSLQYVQSTCFCYWELWSDMSIYCNSVDAKRLAKTWDAAKKSVLSLLLLVAAKNEILIL